VQLSFTDITMSGPEDKSTDSAPVAPANIGQGEKSLLRDLVGDGKVLASAMEV